MSKKTLKAIVESGNDYLIQSKGNSKNFYKKVKDIVHDEQVCDEVCTEEMNRGRKEKRICRTYRVPAIIEEYESCKTVIHLINSGKRNENNYLEEHYYISNKETKDASYYLKGIRGHWSIENKCHWVKDAILYEDRSRVKGMKLAENLSMIRNMVMNIYRLNNIKSIKKGIEKHCNRITESIQLINRLHIEKL